MEGEVQAPKQTWFQRQKQKFLPQRGKSPQSTEVVSTAAPSHPQEQAVIPVHKAEVAEPETELPSQQSIDQYNPQIHREAASRIEPRLANLPEEEAQQRRSVIGIIHAPGRDGIIRDWIFIDISQVPIQTDNPDYGAAFDANASTHLQPGEYAYNNGLTVVNANGSTYMSALQYLNPAGNTVVADGGDALFARSFHEGRGGYVPFSMFPSTAKGTRAALLNAAAPGLAEDYVPNLPNAGQYRFFTTHQGEVVSGIPPQPPASRLASPNAVPQINAPK